MDHAARSTQNGHPVIYFDGVCNLCNGYVTFLIKRDPGKRFRYAPLQSGPGRSALERMGLDTETFESILYEENGRIHTKSSAVLHIVRRLGGLWSLLYVFIVVPKCVRDPLYDFVARNRYVWFGKKETCMVPTDDLKERFLEMS